MPKKELKGSSGLFGNINNAKKLIDSENQLCNEDNKTVGNKEVNLKQNVEQEQESNMEQNIDEKQNVEFSFKTKDERKSKTFYLKSKTIKLIQDLSKKYSKLNKMKISESDIVEELINVALKVINEDQ